MASIRFLTFIALLAVCSAAQAGLTFELRPVDLAGDPTSSFVLGDTVTIRLVATNSDPAGPTIDFGTDTLDGFNAQITATTNDADEAVPGGFTFNNGFSTPGSGGFGTASGAFSVGAADVFAVAGTAPFSISPPEVLAEFSYTADVLGDTDFGFSAISAFNTAAFTDAGEVNPVLIGTSVNVTAVPEPASFAILGIVGTGVVAIRRRRGKKALV
ncbi:secreted protein containing PEP-CTERM bacterial domain protein [Rhodopirellula baltica SH28]|uniref:Secreted protein containing PEP-CTERM bacterial domain protein n=1 Tax=Rhodopirellula baltica SH28 TaxID=993517 RepID=K5DIM6_RHOBT|nr:PEP-CTERM sorting domain-containing protein [Rhodopirellula baltica]EKK02699.1 secreted protein containing PEP-CTERM bacterial domain protein [Rhodopirellula baltica SH28]